ncbi:MAG: hypothetical protein NTU76_00115, partial [Candidatus Taylorbacteria bacterium]|nr:hypothetical protein [Candidatus Taylorbacteria bacterium]
MKVLISFCIILVTLFLFISPPVLFSKLERYYYQKINTSAGIIHYEKQYKAQLDLADSYMVEGNKIMDSIIEVNRTSTSAKETQKFIAGQRTKLYALFDKRESILNTIIATDDLGYEISLPTSQKEFYKKRKAVDENELKAFQVYRRTNDIRIDGNNVFRNFWD